VREPGLKLRVVSPGPVKCNLIVVISRMALLSMRVLKPNSAGKVLSLTVGVVNVPLRGSPSRSTSAIGKVQS
jgi:hypothetical protein